MELSVRELLEKRVSHRLFTDQEIPKELRESILRLAQRAPTAGNLCLYSIIEVENPELKQRLSVTCDNQPFIASAPWVVLFCADYQRLYDAFAGGGEPVRSPGPGDLMLAACDALIAAQTAVLAAESFGLGSCYIGDILENAETHRELLHLPPYVFPVTMVVFGYPQKTDIPPRPRMELSALRHVDTYTPHGSGMTDISLKRAQDKYNAAFTAEMNRSVMELLRCWLG